MSNVEPLLNQGTLWRARELTALTEASVATGIPTGFKSLDALLYDRGWPRASLVEILSGNPGSGELRLITNGLADLSHQESRWVAWINPPHVPYAPALLGAGVDIDKVLLIHPRNHKEALWSLEQTLRSGNCSAVLAWLNETDLKLPELRRIQLSARQGKTWVTLFRPPAASRIPSPAALRLSVNIKSADELQLAIIKRRGGWAMKDIAIQLDQEPATRSPGIFKQQLRLWRDRRTVSRLPRTRYQETGPVIGALPQHHSPHLM